MAQAAIIMNAANLAYRKAIHQTRNKDHLLKTHPLWMTHFAEKLPEDNRAAAPKKLTETVFQRKKRLYSQSEDRYERFAWLVYSHVVSKTWFEAFVLCNIVLIGFATGLDLENRGRSATVDEFVNVSAILTMVVFTCECVLKLVAEAHRPQDYFLDPENGAFNTFDITIVVAGFAFVGNNNGGAVGALRMMRLIRLLTFIKGVPQLRVIMSGLIHGLKSVAYIMMLLFLIIYMFAILGCLMFGVNDPARFGTVSMSMVSLFQVSTLASWTTVAYTSWYGCGNFQGDQYVIGGIEGKTSSLSTDVGTFEGFKCDRRTASPATTFIFFHVYIVLTSWVIMSLFIGVISMGMFEAFQAMKVSNREKRYRARLSENMSLGMEDGPSSGEAAADGEEQKEESSDDAKKTKNPKRKKGKRTLKERIDYILEDVHKPHIPETVAEKVFEDTSALCLKIRETDTFTNLITVTIILVGFVIGLDTSQFLFCERLKFRVDGREDERQIWRDSSCTDTLFSDVVVILSQIIFTAECCIKILAEAYHPERYFTDRVDGSWNCLDFFVVCMGFVEMSPISFIFKSFPVVILRLLRLLRVFRLAKALPRLRSIVEALISGVSAVGWICVLIIAFNYIAACMCMLIFQENDPFHFGSVGRSMFTILRIETLDTWDQVLYLSMFGCSVYPMGYPLVDADLNPNMQCKHDEAHGWAAVALFLVVVIIGSYVLPTVLIGIVAISFDEATRRADALGEMQKGMKKVVTEAEATLPHFFTHNRLIAIRQVFDLIDADSELSLDLYEVSPFYHYTFAKLFGVSLTKEQTEALFHLMDINGDTELGFNEFVMFLVVVKQIEAKCKEDREYRKLAFPDSEFLLDGEALAARRNSTWNNAVARMDQVALDEAWTLIFRFLGEGSEEAAEDGYNPEQMKKVKALFEAYDADGNAALDVREVTDGLVSCGVLINERQSAALIQSLDVNKDGEVSFAELVDMMGEVQRKRREEDEKKKEEDTLRALAQLDPTVGKQVIELRRASNTGSTFDHGSVDTGASGVGLGGSLLAKMNANNHSNHNSPSGGGGGGAGWSPNGGGLSDNDRSLEEVVEMCLERIANRMVVETMVLSKKEAAQETSGASAQESTRGGGGGGDAKTTTTTAPGNTTGSGTDVEFSDKNAELAKTLKRVLTDRVLGEFKYLRRAGGCGGGGGGDVRGTTSSSSNHLGGGVGGDEGGNALTEQLMSNLMSRTVEIARGASPLRGLPTTPPRRRPTEAPPHQQPQHHQQQQQQRQQHTGQFMAAPQQAAGNSSSAGRSRPPPPPPSSPSCGGGVAQSRGSGMSSVDRPPLVTRQQQQQQQQFRNMKADSGSGGYGSSSGGHLRTTPTALGGGYDEYAEEERWGASPPSGEGGFGGGFGGDSESGFGGFDGGGGGFGADDLYAELQEHLYAGGGFLGSFLDLKYPEQEQQQGGGGGGGGSMMTPHREFQDGTRVAAASARGATAAAASLRARGSGSGGSFGGGGNGGGGGTQRSGGGGGGSRAAPTLQRPLSSSQNPLNVHPDRQGHHQAPRYHHQGSGSSLSTLSSVGAPSPSGSRSKSSTPRSSRSNSNGGGGGGVSSGYGGRPSPAPGGAAYGRSGSLGGGGGGNASGRVNARLGGSEPRAAAAAASGGGGGGARRVPPGPGTTARVGSRGSSRPPDFAF